MSFDNKNFEEEIDFKKVKDNPIRWFGIVYPFFLFIIVAIGLYYLTQLDLIEQNKTEPALLDSNRLKSELVFKTSSAVKGIELNLVKSPSEVMLQKGREVYTSTCGTCHGAEGLGDGQAGTVLNPKPRNFQDADGWKNGKKLSEIFKTIQEGIPGTGMTGYDYLETDVKVALAHIVREFSKDIPEITEDELTEMNTTYQLTEDRVTSNQIPVAKAIELIDSETAEFKTLVKQNYESVKKDDSEAAVLLKENTNCLMKAFTLLKNNKDWKTSTEVFSKIVFFGAPDNGFCPGISDLDGEKLSIIHQYLKTKI